MEQIPTPNSEDLRNMERQFREAVQESLMDSLVAGKPQKFHNGADVWLYEGDLETGVPAKILKYEAGVYLIEVNTGGQKLPAICDEEHLTHIH